MHNFTNFIKDNSLARSAIEVFLDYGDGTESERRNILCSRDCLNGLFAGNIDVRNSFSKNGTFKLVIIIHGYVNDKFRVDIISLGDLILSSEIFTESKGNDFYLNENS